MINNNLKRSIITRGLKRLLIENPSAELSLDSLTKSQLESLKTNKQISMTSNSSSSCSTKSSVVEWRKKIESAQWIQCDNEDCMKWRRVTESEVKGVTEETKWFCFMNKDENFRSCDVPEENTHWYDKTARKVGLVYIKSVFKEGTLVLAKYSGYCKWPALITRDPDENVFVTYSDPDEPHFYHVEFLGKPHTRGWVKASSVEKFGKAVLENEKIKQDTHFQQKKRSCSQKKAPKAKPKIEKQTFKRKSVQYAMEEAKHLQLMSLSERLKRWYLDSFDLNFHSSRSKSTTISQANIFSEKLDKGHVNTDVKQHQRNKISTRYKHNYSPESDKTKIQKLNFNDADGYNVQLDFSSNSLVDHSKEEKFVLDVEMYKRNERAFEHDVYRFMTRNNVRVYKSPVWHKTPITLFQLFLAVHERGGYKEVCLNRSWTSVYREVADVDSLNTSQRSSYGSIAKNYYKKNLYPYELYVKGKDFSKYLNGTKPKENRIKNQTLNDLKTQPKDSHVQTNDDHGNSFYDVESENSVDLMEMLGNLEQQGNLCCLETDVAVSQSRLGIDITFCDESPVFKPETNIVEADALSEFDIPCHQDPEAEVPDASIFSFDSNQDKFLYEMQALQKELYEQIECL